MTYDPTRLEALRLVHRGICPRHLYDFPINPDTAESGFVDPHTEAFARQLIDEAAELGGLLDMLSGPTIDPTQAEA